jgi:hypothetical protein
VAVDRDDEPLDADPLGQEQNAGGPARGDAEPPARSESRAAAGGDLRERQLAEHARYRTVVESADPAAGTRDAWTRAAPGLEAEWEAHKRRYPDRDPEPAGTRPDGSWAGGGRRLSPEQNAEASKCASDLKDEAQETIRPAMERIAAADPGRKLAGLEHMLKGEDRLKEKIADELTAKPGQHVRSALDRIADAVRFTLVYPPERYADGVLRDVDRLKAEGFELVKLKNLWHAEQYKGVNSQWRLAATGTRFEMQFHTPESREAKELTHEAYERIRLAAASTEEERDFAEERELENFQRRANALLMTPPGADVIEDFPQKRQTEKEHSGG